jgi:hypothetical protein
MIRVCCPFNIQAKAEVKVDIPEFDPGRTPSPTDAALYGHRGLTGAAERCEKHEYPRAPWATKSARPRTALGTFTGDTTRLSARPTRWQRRTLAIRRWRRRRSRSVGRDEKLSKGEAGSILLMVESLPDFDHMRYTKKLVLSVRIRCITCRVSIPDRRSSPARKAVRRQPSTKRRRQLGPGSLCKMCLAQVEPPDLVLVLLHGELRHGRQAQELRVHHVRHKAYSQQSVEDHEHREPALTCRPHPHTVLTERRQRPDAPDREERGAQPTCSSWSRAGGSAAPSAWQARSSCHRSGGDSSPSAMYHDAHRSSRCLATPPLQRGMMAICGTSASRP